VNRHPIHRLLSAPRTRGLAVAGSALALLTMFCLQLAMSNRAAWQSVLEPGPASVDEALAAVCGSLALAIALWLLSALLLSLLAALGSGSSALSAALATGARVLAPKTLRNAVAALMGVAIATAPAVAVAAEGSAPGPTPAQARSAQGFIPNGELSPAWAATTPSDNTGRGSGAARGKHAEPSPLGAGPVSSVRPEPTPGPSADGQVGASTSAPRSDLLPQWLPSRPPRPTESAPMVSTARRASVDQDDEIVVRRGDTLWNLAERHLGPGTTDGAVIGSDPDHLVPGERLRPPERNAYAGPYLSGTKTADTTTTKAGTNTDTKAGASPEAKPGSKVDAKVDAKTSAKADVERRGAR
jgi:hypothetical protein